MLPTWPTSKLYSLHTETAKPDYHALEPLSGLPNPSLLDERTVFIKAMQAAHPTITGF